MVATLDQFDDASGANYGAGLWDAAPCPRTNNLDPTNPRTCDPATCTSAPKYPAHAYGCYRCDEVARVAYVFARTTGDATLHRQLRITDAAQREETDSYAACFYLANVFIHSGLLSQPKQPPPSPHSACAQAAPGRIDLRELSVTAGEEIWCYHMDDTRNDLVERYGACDSFYVTTAAVGATTLRLCYLDASSGKCKSSRTLTYCVGHGPPSPPSPPNPPAPPPSPPKPPPLPPRQPPALVSEPLNPRALCSAGLKAYQFISYTAIYGTGGTLCYRVERARAERGRMRTRAFLFCAPRTFSCLRAQSHLRARSHFPA